MLSVQYSPRILNGRQNLQNRPTVSGRFGESCYGAILVLDGAASLEIDGRKRRLPLSTGVISWPGAQGQAQVTPGSTWRQIAFDVVPQACTLGGGQNLKHVDDHPQPAPHEIWGVTPDQVVSRDQMASFTDMMLLVCSHWWRGHMPRARADLALGQWLLDWIEPQLPAEASRPTHSDFLSRVEYHAQESLEFGVTVDDMARRAGMSRRYFQDIYRRSRGIGPGEFLRQQRLTKAKRLLRSSEFGIAGIAAMCGYQSLSSFSRRFRAATGMTPSTWRRDHRT